MGKRLAGAIAAGMLCFLVLGAWPAHASVSAPSIDPADGSFIRSSNNQISVTVSTDRGLAWVRLEISGPNGYSKIIRHPDSGQFSPAPTGSHTENFGWTFDPSGISNGAFTVKASAGEVGCSSCVNASSETLNVSVPPKTPSGLSGKQSGHSVQLSWTPNHEPDLLGYVVSRAGAGQVGSIGAPCGNPCTFTDNSLPQSGYSGNYTYQLAAYRSSPDPSGQVYSGTTSRTVAVSEPRPSGGGGSGGGGNNSGGGSDGGIVGGGSSYNPAPGTSSAPGSPTASPQGVDPNDPCVFGGSSCPGYSNKLPYQPQYSLAPDGSSVKGIKESRQFALGETQPLDVRKRLLPVAGGLLALMAALHFRRVIRDR